MLSERIKRLRDRQRSTTPTICLDRARLVTKYYQGVATEPNKDSTSTNTGHPMR